MTAKVPMSETGAATAGISVARPLRRNRNTTSTTSPIARQRAFSTSFNEARMVGERSMVTLRSALSGNQARSWGSMALTLSTVSMMLAPGERKTISSTEGLPLARAMLRTSCAPSSTSATSDRRMGLPSLTVMIRSRNSAAVRA